jgi:serine/threonine protein kinase
MMDNLTDSLLSQQLDEYRLDVLLGQGGMAHVYRGFDVQLKRQVAIKVINTSYRADPDYVMRFEREAQAIARLKHAHIIGVYRFGQADGLLYIAMEYIEGTDLGTVLATYREDQEFIRPEDARRIMQEVCSALDYAHSQGVIHRDVKPSNIMLDKQGNAFLTDFGLVLLDNKTRGEIFGSPQYIAPEQVISSANAVPQSDLYAIGIILYEMFTHRLPFEATHPQDVAMLHLSEPPPPPRSVNPQLSSELEAVILKALAKDPAERYPTGAALVNALDQALPVMPLKPSPPPKVVDPGQSEAIQSLTPTPDVAPVRSQAKKGEVIPPRYLMKNVRALLIELTEAFTVDELLQLYYDIPDFRPVRHQLAQSSSKAELIDQLLEYAEQTLQIDILLALAKEHNLAIYEKHQPYYELITSGRGNLVGRNLGKYHLVDWLGQGGMADVYKAYQSGLARYVAIKVIHAHLIDEEELIERFESEALAVAGLHHPNIVQVFDFDREDDQSYMVMEFVAGPTLARELKAYKDKQQLFPLAETVTIFESLASAIDYAHAQGMIHRDLKPSNIMFTPSRRVVLTDFGIAHITGVPSYTMANVLLGTPAYMSPEQAQGEQVDERSDIYSLGIILYEIATGRVPFEGDTPVAIIMKLVNGSWALPTTVNPALPEAVEQVILKAMNKDPAGRYQTATDMAQALQQAVAHSLLAESAVPGVSTDLTNAVPQATPLQLARDAAKKSRPALVDGDTITVGNISGGYVAIGPGAQVTLVSQGVGSDDIARLFEIIYGQIETRPDDPNVDKEELIQIVKKIQREVARGEHANPNKIKRWLETLIELAPDICKATVAGLLEPGASVPAPIRQIAAQA